MVLPSEGILKQWQNRIFFQFAKYIPQSWFMVCILFAKGTKQHPWVDPHVIDISRAMGVGPEDCIRLFCRIFWQWVIYGWLAWEKSLKIHSCMLVVFAVSDDLSMTNQYKGNPIRYSFPLCTWPSYLMYEIVASQYLEGECGHYTYSLRTNITIIPFTLNSRLCVNQMSVPRLGSIINKVV